MPICYGCITGVAELRPFGEHLYCDVCWEQVTEHDAKYWQTVDNHVEAKLIESGELTLPKGDSVMATHYELVWRNKFLTAEAETVQEMAEQLSAAAEELKSMAESGVELEGGQENDYAMLTTTGPKVAERFGFNPREGP